MAQSEMPRRPAMLDAARADVTVGNEGPVVSAAVTHTAAWVFIGVDDETFTDADAAHLHEVVRTSEVDTTAYVWSRNPEFTLPGALWHAYLLHKWYHRDPLLVAERYTEDSRTPITRGLETPVRLRPLSFTMGEVNSLPRGDLIDDDFEYVLGEALRAMRVLVTGEARVLWVEDPADPFTHRITMRHSALLITADELDVVAREVAIGILNRPRVRYVAADFDVPQMASQKARTGVTWRAHQGTGTHERLPLFLYI